MNYYVPIFAKIVDSSLWAEPDFVVKVFITMLAKKDKDNVCRGSAFNIARWANKTEGEVLEALRLLSSPDTKREEPQLYEGRRIERVADGWLVLNGEFYQRLMKSANRRESKTEWQREKRQEEARESEVESPKKRLEKPTLEMVKLEAAKIGLSDLEAEKFFSYYQANGWRAGKNPMKNWLYALSGWKMRSQEYGGNGITAGSKPPSVFEMKTVLDAKEKALQKLKNQHATETGLGVEWDTDESMLAHKKLQLEIKQLAEQLASKF